MSGGVTHRSFHARSERTQFPTPTPASRPRPLPRRNYPMKTKLVVSAAAVLIGGASLLFASPAFADDEPTDTTSAAAVVEQVCDELTSGKINVDEPNVYEITITAPAGNLITGYCVKAGSVNNENGPVYVELDEPVASVTFKYKDGTKEISHYSYSYAL